MILDYVLHSINSGFKHTIKYLRWAENTCVRLAYICFIRLNNNVYYWYPPLKHSSFCIHKQTNHIYHVKCLPRGDFGEELTAHLNLGLTESQRFLLLYSSIVINCDFTRLPGYRAQYSWVICIFEYSHILECRIRENSSVFRLLPGLQWPFFVETDPLIFFFHAEHFHIPEKCAKRGL